jgi:hypothetical protein
MLKQDTQRQREYTIYNGPTNALVCNKTLIQMSHNTARKTNERMLPHNHT